MKNLSRPTTKIYTVYPGPIRSIVKKSSANAKRGTCRRRRHLTKPSFSNSNHLPAYVIGAFSGQRFHTEEDIVIREYSMTISAQDDITFGSSNCEVKTSWYDLMRVIYLLYV